MKKATGIRGARSGQVALFVALIFQILFLFFAVVVNVGLLVHQKINLQNSVDLAAYYGAMKQAEMLNAMGHVNYQIRQSWKLLSWRYRVIGTSGTQAPEHPYDNKNKILVGTEVYNGQKIGPSGQALFDKPDFCISYTPFKPATDALQNFCAGTAPVPAFKPPAVIPYLGNITSTINTYVSLALNQVYEACRFYGPLNYFALAEMVMGFKIDQKIRKDMLVHMSRALALEKNDFIDLDGDRASIGIQKVLEKNLTSINRVGLEYQIINGLGQPGCDASGATSSSDPAKFISEIKTLPGFFYRDYACGSGNGNVKPAPDLKELGPDPNGNLPYPANLNSPYSTNTGLTNLIGAIKDYTSAVNPSPWNYSLGYEKNPWCVAYVGVKASTTPKVAFLPFKTIRLTAVAFAKPFGGSLGPWYNDIWRVDGNESDSSGTKVDALAPLRVKDYGSISINDVNDKNRFPNYSRYPGDPYGLKSRALMGYFGEAIYRLDPGWLTGTTQTNASGFCAGANLQAPSICDYLHLYQINDPAGDVMAWNSTQDKTTPMRNLESLAIAPDLFDISYYSIQPDYYNTYFTRMRDGGLFKNSNGNLSAYSGLLRSDLGSRMKDSQLESFSIKDQVKAAKDALTYPGLVNAIDNVFTYILNPLRLEESDVKRSSLYHVLTGFIAKNLMDFSVDEERFGKCYFAAPSDKPNAGNCPNGGRTGYSVKLVSYDWLKSSDLDLGDPSGKGRAGLGALKNPPPGLTDDWK